MTVSIKDLLESKGIPVKADNLSNLELKWSSMKQLRDAIDDQLPADADIALRNIPGGGEHE